MRYPYTIAIVYALTASSLQVQITKQDSNQSLLIEFNAIPHHYIGQFDGQTNSTPLIKVITHQMGYSILFAIQYFAFIRYFWMLLLLNSLPHRSKAFRSRSRGTLGRVGTRCGAYHSVSSGSLLGVSLADHFDFKTEMAHLSGSIKKNRRDPARSKPLYLPGVPIYNPYAAQPDCQYAKDVLYLDACNGRTDEDGV